MKTKVKLISGRSFLVPGNTIGELKGFLHSLVKVPESQQAIYYLGELRHDKEEIKPFGVDPELLLKLILEPLATITIKTMSGNKFEFKVHLSITKVKYLKKELSYEIGLAPNQFMFLYMSKKLNDEDILETCGIKDQSVIQNVLIVQGGK